jgi:hypothetical protein
MIRLGCKVTAIGGTKRRRMIFYEKTDSFNRRTVSMITALKSIKATLIA